MPIITANNHNKIDLFIRDNIVEFTADSRPYEYNKIKEIYRNMGYSGDCVISATMIRKKLNDNYKAIISSKRKKKKLEKELRIVKSDSDIEQIAIKYYLNLSQVKRHYKQLIIDIVRQGFEQERSSWEEATLARLLKYVKEFSESNEYHVESIKKDYERCIAQIEYWLLNIGFSQNLTNEIKGQDVANQGDSAQFIFVGRAIMAGFNCSNVDVRSSSYDAIISKPESTGKATFLKTVQVKGITPGAALPLYKRPRGGSGSNSGEGRNQSVDLSTDDADLLVAVDKLYGACYIIPMEEVADFLANGKRSISWNDLEKKYKEKWNYV